MPKVHIVEQNGNPHNEYVTFTEDVVVRITGDRLDLKVIITTFNTALVKRLINAQAKALEVVPDNNGTVNGDGRAFVSPQALLLNIIELDRYKDIR